ncbi:MAG: hypothetical protein M3Y35_01180, partial [Actinomycetota bacterium]|nr:hypothetical protein [Actinomycetota bacterium]
MSFYAQLTGSPNIVRSDRLVADAADLPALSMEWHNSPYDEHPVADVSKGQNKIWQTVDAIAAAGHWQDTVFLLTWDDWGGWDDHVATPNVEHTPDGVQLAYGPGADADVRRPGRPRNRQPLQLPRQHRQNRAGPARSPTVGSAPPGLGGQPGRPHRPDNDQSTTPKVRRHHHPAHPAHTQFDTPAVLPYYAYLAATGAFLENHCSGFGTNS